MDMTVLLFFGIIIGFLGLFSWLNREKPPSEEELREANLIFSAWEAAYEDWLHTDKDEYMPYRHAQDWKRRHPGLKELSDRTLRCLSQDSRNVYERSVQLITGLESKRKQRNELFIFKRLREREQWFDGLNEHPLTPAQRRAVVVNEDNTLVVAAAGTGKTTTL
jgi:hypothetical protein